MRIRNTLFIGIPLLAATVGTCSLAHSAPPVIVTPLRLAPSISSPAANARVTSPLTVRGTAGKNNKVEVSVKAIYTGGEQDLGTFKVTTNNDGKWNTTPINLWLPEGAKNAKYTISAVQYFNDRPSARKSITVLPPLNVIFRPPVMVGVFNLAPRITSPVNNTRVNSPLTISGTGDKNHPVSVNVVAHFTTKLRNRNLPRQQDLGTFRANPDRNGKWKTSPVNLWLPENAQNARFEITATQKIGTRTVTSPVVKVTPPLNIKFIPPRNIPTDAVLLRPAPAITSPANNTRIKSPLIVQGTASKDNKVEISIKATYTGGERHLGTFIARVDNNGKWRSIPINVSMPRGSRNVKYEVTAVQIDNGKRSAAATIHLLPQSVLVPMPMPQVVPAPKITQPRATSKVPTTIIVRGEGVSGHKVQVSIKVEYRQRFGIAARKVNMDLGPFNATVLSNGKWSSPQINPEFPQNAYDIKYTFTAVQKSGNRTSAATTVQANGHK